MAILFAFAKAFESFDITRLETRIIFWFAIIVPIWLSTACASMVILKKLKLPIQASFFVNISAALFISLLFTIWVKILHDYFLAQDYPFQDIFIHNFMITLLMSISVWLIVNFSNNPHIDNKGVQRQQADATLKKDAEFLSRLNANKRGEIHYIIAADHYLEVYTDKGHDLIRMRMKDAIAILPPKSGMQIHRSYWVAFGMMEKIISKQGKSFLCLKNQNSYPVSKKYLKDLKRYL